MVSLEQVKLLESKVSRTIEYVKKVSEEKAQLKEKLDSYQKRIEELEILIQRFKEDQSRIEDGILSALDRLNKFEDAVESKLSAGTKAPSGAKAPGAEAPAKPGAKAAPQDSTAPLGEDDTAGGELDIF